MRKAKSIRKASITKGFQEKYKIPRTTLAMAHMQKNFLNKDKFNLISETAKIFDLAFSTLDIIYKDIQMNRLWEEKTSTKVDAEALLMYKGRRRQFFQFDDSNLYKRVSK